MPLQPFEIYAVLLLWLTVAWRLGEAWADVEARRGMKSLVHMMRVVS